MENPTKRTGRPIKPAQAGERASLGLKVTADIKGRLDAAAQASGRTQSQEAELRLERSFTMQDQIWEMFGGRAAFNAALLMSSSFAHVGNQEADGRPVGEWMKDPTVFDRAMRGVVDALWSIHPDASWERKQAWMESLYRGMHSQELNKNPWIEPGQKADPPTESNAAPPPAASDSATEQNKPGLFTGDWKRLRRT
jgi:TraY domain